MKQILTLLSIILCSNLLAQNWQPITLNEVYNYSIDDEVYTIKVDSVEEQGSASVFYLNRVALPCDTCSGDFQNAYLKNQPQFLMRKMIKSGDEPGIYTFSDTLNFTINTLAGLGDNWDFLPSQSITAEVVEVSTQEVFGVIDNVKIIELSNGKTFTISENHGIITFPDFYSEGAYTLIGMETSEQGYSVPDFWDFYNFEVEDVYQYKEQSGYFAPQGGPGTKFSKNAIESIELFTDHIKFDKTFIGHITTYDGSGFPSITDYFNYQDEIYEMDSVHKITNSYKGQLVDLSDEFEGVIPDPSYGIVNYTYEDNVIIGKGLKEQEWAQTIYHPTEHEDILMPIGIEYKKAYEVQKGLVHRYLFVGEIYEEEQLLGCVISGDTTGIVYSDSWLLTIDKNKSINDGVKCFPNPTSSSLTISLEDASPVISYRIYNSTGQTVDYKRSNSSQKEITIDLDHIKEGVYIVEVVTQDETIKRSKFVKQ